MAVVDQVCCPEASTKLRRQTQAVDREHLAQAFAETVGSGRPVTFQPFGVLLEFRHALIGVEFPGRFDRGFRLIMLILRKMSQNIFQLAIAKSLHRLAVTSPD